MTAPSENRLKRTLNFASGPIARGSIVSVAIKVTGIGLSFVQAILAARLLGAEGYGLVAVALSVAQIGATLALFGYGTLAMREIAGWLASGKQHLLGPFTRHAAGSVFVFSLLAASIILAVSTLAADRLAEYRLVLLISALIIPALALIHLLRGITQGFGEVGSAQWPGEILRPLLLIAMVLGIIALQPPLTAPQFLILFAIAGFGSALASALLVRSLLKAHLQPSPESSPTPKWLGKAAPFFALSLLAILQGEVATIMLAMFATPEQAGLYQPIARLSPIIALPTTAVMMRYAPRIAELWTSDELPRLVSINSTFTLTTTGLTIAATIALAGLGPWILLAFGAEFAGLAPLLWIIGAAQIFDAACGPVGPILMMTDKSRLALIGYSAGVLITAALGLALIPLYGASGAAYAVSGGIVTFNIIMLWMVNRYNGFDPSIMGSIFAPGAVQK